MLYESAQWPQRSLIAQPSLGALEIFFYNENLSSKNVFRGISCPNLLVLLIPYPLGISDSGLALFNIMQYFENMLQASRNMLIVLLWRKLP